MTALALAALPVALAVVDPLVAVAVAVAFALCVPVAPDPLATAGPALDGVADLVADEATEAEAEEEDVIAMNPDE